MDSRTDYINARDVKVQRDLGSRFAAAKTPVALFRVSLATGLGANKNQYAVSRDGRFLLNEDAEISANTPMPLILELEPELKTQE